MELEIDEGFGCSSSLLSHPMKDYCLQIFAHFGVWTSSSVMDEVSSTCAQDDGSETTYEACCPGFQLRTRTIGLFWKCFLGFLAAMFQTKILKCGIWPIFIACFAKEPSQSYYQEDIHDYYHCNKKKGIHLRNKPLGSVNKNTRISRSLGYLCQILSHHQAIAQRNPDFQPTWVS